MWRKTNRTFSRVIPWKMKNQLSHNRNRPKDRLGATETLNDQECNLSCRYPFWNPYFRSNDHSKERAIEKRSKWHCKTIYRVLMMAFGQMLIHRLYETDLCGDMEQFSLAFCNNNCPFKPTAIIHLFLKKHVFVHWKWLHSRRIFHQAMICLPQPSRHVTIRNAPFGFEIEFLGEDFKIFRKIKMKKGWVKKDWYSKTANNFFFEENRLSEGRLSCGDKKQCQWSRVLSAIMWQDLCWEWANQKIKFVAFKDK